MIGESDFDLAKYGKSITITERLAIRGAEDEDSFIEIIVKTKSLDASTPSVTSNS
jgi:hypothetical protein